MNEKNTIDAHESPLSLKEIQRVEELNLSILAKHHLRLLAHCLFSFKAMDDRSDNGNTSIPSV